MCRLLSLADEFVGALVGDLRDLASMARGSKIETVEDAPWPRDIYDRSLLDNDIAREIAWVQRTSRGPS